MKGLITVSVDAEAKDAVSKKGLNISEVCNRALWAIANKDAFSVEDMQDVEDSVERVLMNAVEAGKREQVLNKELLEVSAQLRAFVDREDYLGTVSETKGEMDSTGNTAQRLAFWSRVLEKLKESTPATPQEKGVCE